MNIQLRKSKMCTKGKGSNSFWILRVFSCIFLMSQQLQLQSYGSQIAMSLELYIGDTCGYSDLFDNGVKE